MVKIEEVAQAFKKIISSISPTKRKKLTSDIKIVEDKIKNLPGAFWADPARKEDTKNKMKAAWKFRAKQKYLITCTDLKDIVLDDIDEIASLVLKAPHTVRCMLSRGKGVAQFIINDDIITVERLKK